MEMDMENMEMWFPLQKNKLKLSKTKTFHFCSFLIIYFFLLLWQQKELSDIHGKLQSNTIK